LTLNEIQVEDEIVLGCSADEILGRLPRRLSHQILSWVDKTPDAPAVREAQQELTYSQLGASVEEAKGLLVQAGLRPGDRVMLVAENGSPCYVCFWRSVNSMVSLP